MASKKGKIVGIFSAKGGVGKTVNTLNLAGISEVLKRKTLIIDLDLTSGVIAVALNREPKKNIYNFIEDLNNNNNHDLSEYVTKYDDYIDFLACPKDPRQGTRIDSRYIELVFNQASYKYDVILVDMNHILNDVNLTALDLADNILFFVTNDPFDLKNMKSLISIFKDLDITKYKVILNNSVDINKNYFNLYDLKTIIKSNIDYTISSRAYIPSIDSHIMNGEILSLNPKAKSLYSKDYLVFNSIMIDILKKDSGKDE